MSCSANDRTVSTVNSKADQECGSDCEKFSAFADQAVHLEIESSGRSQIIYNIDPKNLSAITLSKTTKISGTAIGAHHITPDVHEERADKSDPFFDILAIPVVNRTSFLSPRVAITKSRLTNTANFNLDLISGLSYTLILNPEGTKDRAPLHIDTGILSNDRVVDFHLERTPIKLSGKVVFENDNVILEDGLPRMRARLMLGTRLVSSVGTIDAEGKFALDVSQPLFDDAEIQPLNLVIEPTDLEAALPRIRHKLDIDRINRNFDVGDINLGTLKKPFSVIFEVHGSDDSQIGNAILYLRAPVGVGTAFVKKQVDRSGCAKFMHLYEGNYDIAVIPPVDSQFAMRVIKDVKLDSKENIQISIDLEKRKHLNAVVLSPLGQPVSGAQIQFSRTGETGNLTTEDIYDDNLFKLTAITNDEGKVCHRKFGYNTSDKNECSALLLDDGRYLAHIIPPPGTQLADEYVEFDFPDKNQLSLYFKKPKLLTGRILLHDKTTPAALAFVTVYLAETNATSQPTVMGNTMTDENGFFRAFVSGP